jgi:hypothetical protein
MAQCHCRAGSQRACVGVSQAGVGEVFPVAGAMAAKVERQEETCMHSMCQALFWTGGILQ